MMPKAYRCYSVYEDYQTVVFADTPSKAKVIAMSTDSLMDAPYLEIRAVRMPDMDAEYRGHSEMEWDNIEDRRALVKHGWFCLEPDRIDDCAECPVRDECEGYQDWLA